LVSFLSLSLSSCISTPRRLFIRSLYQVRGIPIYHLSSPNSSVTPSRIRFASTASPPPQRSMSQGPCRATTCDIDYLQRSRLRTSCCRSRPLPFSSFHHASPLRHDHIREVSFQRRSARAEHDDPNQPTAKKKTVREIRRWKRAKAGTSMVRMGVHRPL